MSAATSSSSSSSTSASSSSSTQRGVCVVIGVGPGNGSSLVRRFASAGHPVALLARRTDTSEQLATQLPTKAKAYACDITNPQAVQQTFQAIPTDLGTHIDTVVYNAGSGSWGTIDKVDEKQFEAAWRTNTYGAFLAVKQVVDDMTKRGSGSIIFIGATSSKRGMPFTTVFAPAKAAQRIFAESLARTLGPKGIHVAVLMIDGVVDIPGSRDSEQFKEKPKEFFVQPDDVAEQALMLANQPRSTWTFEIEVRPFGEKW